MEDRLEHQRLELTSDAAGPESIRSDPVDSPPSRSPGVPIELRWLFPLAIMVAAVTAYLLTRGQRGSEIATILSLPASVASVVSVMISYRTARPPHGRAGSRLRRLVRGPAWRSVGAVAAVVAVTASVVVAVRVMQPASPCPDPNRHDPARYLRDRDSVTIGVNGRLPGWSTRPATTDNDWRGFDIDLGRFLANRYDFKPEFDYLSPSEREPKLNACKFDLVLANYSITPERAEQVDFAGPYFLDHLGKLDSTAKPHDASTTRVCVTTGTTSSSVVKDPVRETSLPDCMVRFLNPHDSVTTVVTDKSILAAYKHERNIVDAKLSDWRDEHGQLHPEEYGIGIPHGSPELCSELSRALDDFLKDGERSEWSRAFAANLKPSIEGNPGDHRPTRSDEDHCRSS
jgi:glutamate transport system substrate-binding protein